MFQTHFLAPKVFGHCYCSEASQGRISTRALVNDPSSTLQVRRPVRPVFLSDIPIFIRCRGAEIHRANSYGVFRGYIFKRIPLAQRNRGRP